jgi:hypothetical protein
VGDDFCSSTSAVVNARTLLKRATQAIVRRIDIYGIIPFVSGQEFSISISPSSRGSDNVVNIFLSSLAAFAFLFRLRCNFLS